MIFPEFYLLETEGLQDKKLILFLKMSKFNTLFSAAKVDEKQ